MQKCAERKLVPAREKSKRSVRNGCARHAIARERGGLSRVGRLTSDAMGFEEVLTVAGTMACVLGGGRVGASHEGVLT